MTTFCGLFLRSSVFKNNLAAYKELPFIGEMANDEQVWNGPGINIPMISIGRGHYSEYHTSDDTPQIVSYSNITQSIEIVFKILEILDIEHIPERLTKEKTNERVREQKQKKHEQIIGDYIPKRLI